MLTDVQYAFAGPGVPLASTTLPQKLSAAGYATHHVGKWHVGFFHPAHTPPRLGFHTALGSYDGHVVHSVHCRADRNRCWRHPRYPSSDPRPPTNNTLFDLFEDSGSGHIDEAGYRFWQTRQSWGLNRSMAESVSDRADPAALPTVHATELYTRRFAQIVAAHANDTRPLFVFLCWSGPHVPFQPLSLEDVRAVERLRPATYYSGCEWLDAHFGVGVCDSSSCACNQLALEADAPPLPPASACGVAQGGTPYADPLARAYDAYESRKWCVHLLKCL